jgi:hypothetical protein
MGELASEPKRIELAPASVSERRRYENRPMPSCDRSDSALRPSPAMPNAPSMSPPFAVLHPNAMPVNDDASASPMASVSAAR